MNYRRRVGIQSTVAFPYVRAVILNCKGCGFNAR